MTIRWEEDLVEFRGRLKLRGVLRLPFKLNKTSNKPPPYFARHPTRRRTMRVLRIRARRVSESRLRLLRAQRLKEQRTMGDAE